MLIQIERCSLPSAWYKEIIGSIIECNKEDETRFYSSRDNDWYVLKKDARVINERKDHEP